MGLEPRQLNDLDEWLLDELREHRSTPKLLQGRLETVRDDVPSAGYINQRLRRLEEHDHLENLEGTGVYELVDDPREDDTPRYRLDVTDKELSGADKAELRARLQNAFETRDDAQARADQLEEELEDCREQLEQARADAGGAVDDQLVTAIEDAYDAASRAQDRLPDDAPGEMPLEDAVRTLEEAIDDD